MGLTNNWPVTAEDDLAQASKAVRIRLIGTKSTFADAWDDALLISKALVDVHWNSIERVADQLIWRGRMSGAAVRAAM